MPMSNPPLIELVESVRAFLESELLPGLRDATAFNTQVAINVLKIVERELKSGGQLDQEEMNRLKAMLGADGDSAAELNRCLLEKIRNGGMDTSDRALTEHLIETTLGKLSIDNPNYASYREILKSRGKS